MKDAGLVLLIALLAVINSQNIKLDPYSLNPGCLTDTDCLPGWFCLSSTCTDRCVLMKCADGTICKDGLCNSICSHNSQCERGFVCNGQYCVDRCKFTKCSAGSVCSKGKCLSSPKKCKGDQECNNGFYCTAKGFCEDKCLQPNYCSSWWSCNAGECVPYASEDTACPDPLQCDESSACNENEILIDGQCVLKPTFPEKYFCKDPRPNNATCPTIYWFIAPDPVVCGVDANGNYINFPIECYACKQKDIVFYYNTTCDKVERLSCDASTKCAGSSTCIAGVCVPKGIWPICQENIKRTNCKKERPTEQICSANKLIAAQENIVCGVTTSGQHINYPAECQACKNTEVQYFFNQSCEYLTSPCPVQSIRCKANTDCPTGYSCQDRACIDTCLIITCPTRTVCRLGVCQAVFTPSCTLFNCKLPNKCVNGACVDACSGVVCSDPTMKCVNGQCPVY